MSNSDPIFLIDSFIQNKKSDVLNLFIFPFHFFRKLFAELLGKKTGHSKGMGGSMHLIDKTVGFYGSVPIVSGTVSLALGAAMASRLKKTKSMVFVSCTLKKKEQLIASATGVWKVIKKI